MRWSFFVLAFMVIGCRTDSGPVLEEVVPASGVLTYQGKPLEGYVITLLPEDDRRPAVGTSAAQGKFTLGTNDVADGAPPGKHKVTVTWVGPKSSSEATEQPIDNPALLPKPPVVLPEKYASPEATDVTVEVPPGGTSDLKIELD